MTALLERLLGRLPLGWLQLIHRPPRFAAALAGVAFANILVFMQLGFLGALIESIALPYRAMEADIVIAASDTNTLADSSPLPRQRMYEALAVPGVASATPLYYAKLDWKQPDGTIRTLDVFGVDPERPSLSPLRGNAALDTLKRADHALIDNRTRNAPPGLFAAIDAGQPYTFEAKNRTINIAGTIAIGGGFAADGYLVVSDQTFLRLFQQRAAGAPNYILVRTEAGVPPQRVVAALESVLPADDAAPRTLADTIARDQRFQTTQRPVGMVFGFGIVIGALVGGIIVYQVLSSDVADHIREYATLKAVGYDDSYFLGIIVEEAAILAAFGFVPGLLVALGLYTFVSAQTALPLTMTFARALALCTGTMAMCVLSGFVATRRLARADPAELF
ncbi:MAG: FtsX-like permease family protein [Alphaproteobacteria bacterium]|nr:FtsX-like permease family protein [Alphaproteobacteria bacterium]